MTHSCHLFLLLLLQAAMLVNAAQIHTIRVGFAGGHVFDPTTTTADVGDLVVFEFFPTNHSVVRGEYTESEACGSSQCNPCVPYELIHPGQTGFHSENFLTQTVSTNGDVPTFNITIGDNFPIWFYCTALDSCHPNGMVGVINPAEGQSIDTQKSAAINADYQLVPGQSWPAEGSSPSSQPNSTSPPSKNSKSQKVSGGAIAGIVIGILLATVLTAALVFFVRRTRQRNAPKNPEDSLSLTERDAEEQTVPVSMEFEPATPRTQNDLVSPISPPPQRKKSILHFYKYPFAEKPLVAPKGHPALRSGGGRNTTSEFEGEEEYIGRGSR
ncbi:hypothetical protein EG328_006868 [Venturia inaequalis]|uniref:Extracellular serine-rich protein n=1 Tax=Venturia inaequalis TaxID=5025 RepID=A0A8H3UGX1_VENIN|nr:hypothetical protein EG328_006868 [Venturia inaequalis]